jgi:hypothetical protein
MNDELERIWKKAIMAYLGFCTDLQNSPYPIITEGNFWYLISKNTVIQFDGLL